MLTSEKTNKIFKCVACRQDFVFTADEQEYYQARGLKDPVRCPICRATLQAAKQDHFRGKISR